LPSVTPDLPVSAACAGFKAQLLFRRDLPGERLAQRAGGGLAAFQFGRAEPPRSNSSSARRAASWS
jgi:hypothetical protein